MAELDRVRRWADALIADLDGPSRPAHPAVPALRGPPG